MMKKYSRGGLPPIGDSIASGNRMSKENAKDAKAVAKTSPRKPPMAGMAAAKSAARVGRQEGAEMRKMGMKKGGMAKKRYADGGMAGAALDLEATARRGEMERELGRMDFSTPKVEAPAKKQSFSEAFAAARKRGDKTFTWNGGSYGTKMKGEGDKPAKPSSTASTASTAPAKPASTAPAKPASTAPAKPAPAKAAAKKGSDTVSKTGVGSAINRGVGAVNDQMSTQARNMAERRKKNPDIFTRLGFAKGGAVTRGDGIARKGKTKGRII